MNASDRFKPVIKVAANREADAAKKLGQSRQKQQSEETKLQNLREYHAEYMQRFRDAASAGITASQLREYQAFISRLEKTIGEQLVVVQNSSRVVVQKKQAWQQQHIRTRSMDAAMERLQHREQKARDAQEQKMSDEIAQRISRR